MAEIEHVHFEDLTGRQHSSSTFTTQSTLSSASLSANATYLMYVVCQLTCTQNSAGTGVQYRIQDSGVTITHSEISMEVAFANVFQTYSFLHKLVTDGTPGDITFQSASIDNTATVEQDTLQVILIRLDDDLTENTDWLFNEDTTLTTHTTGFADFASIAIPQDASAAKNWLVIGNVRTDVVNVGKNFESRINFDADTEVAPEYSMEGEHADDIYSKTLIRVFSVASGVSTKTAKMQCRDDSAAGAENDHLRSAIFAINLTDVFDQHVSLWNEAETATTAGDGLFDEIDTLDFTPDTASQNWLVIGQTVFDQGALGAPAYLRMQQAGTTVPLGRDVSNRFAINTRDATEELVGEYLAYLPSVAASLQDIDIDIADNGASTATGEDRAWAIFSLELAPPPSGISVPLAFDHLAMMGHQ